MMCRTSIFALLAAAMTFAAEGYITVNAGIGANEPVGSATVTAGIQSMAVSKGQSVGWQWTPDTAYTASASDVGTGYTARWAVQKVKDGPWVMDGAITETITLPSTYSGCYLWFYGKPNTYTVTLDQNGGSGGTTSVNATYDAAMPAATMPTRTGYTFNGYWDDAAGHDWASPVEYKPYYTAAGASANKWDLAFNLTLYAGWDPNTYTVTLHLGDAGGTAGSVTATYDAAMPPITKPTRTGYTFTGYWYNSSTWENPEWVGFYTRTGASAQNWNIASPATLYAGWDPNTYTVTLHLGDAGGTAGSVTATYDAAMPPITKPTRTGYTFTGYWYNSGTWENPIWVGYYTQSGASAQNWNIASSATIYAGWDVNTYAVALDPDGGSGGSASVTATYDAPMPSATMPTRTGYTFGGYYTARNGGGTQYYTASGESTTNWHETSVLTLYAKWTPNTYTVTFDANGGSVSPGTMDVTYDSTYGNLPTPTFADHSFVGWFTAPSGGDQITSSSSVTITGPQTLHARWAQESYEVWFKAFDKNGVDIGGNSQTIGMGISTYLTYFSELDIVPPRGYSFAEWNTVVDGSGIPYEDHANVYNLTNVANTTVFLYAQWSPNPYEVAFWPNGADGGETMTNQLFTYDVTQQLNTVEFTYPGRAFEKWSSDTNHNYQTEYYLDGAEVANLATGGVVNLYANWTNIVYTVAFDPNGGEADPEHPMDPITCIYSVPTNLPACAFTRDGYGFKGWMTNVNDEVLFLDRARVTNLTTKAEEVMLYACWTGVTYAVVFDTLGEGVMTNGSEEVSVLTNSYVVGDAWGTLPVPTSVDTQHWEFAGWLYVDAQGVKRAIPAEVPPPSVGTTNLVADWSRKVDELAAAVDAPELKFRTFATYGNQGLANESSYPANWFAQTNFAYGSTNAVQSGALPTNTTDSCVYVSWLTTTVETNGVLTFWWKCDAKPLIVASYQKFKLMPGWCGDSFTFGLFDSTFGITNTVAQLTDHVDWTQVVYTNNSESAVTFAWVFAYADYGKNNGGGTGWVDRVTWTPEGGPTVEVTPTHGVAYSWLREKFPELASATGDALEAKAESQSPGESLPPGKTWADGTPVMVWQDYWAGTNPTNATDLFRANIMVSNDMAHITWQPDLSVTGDPQRVYHVLSAPTPSAGWAVLQSNVVERLEVELPVTDDSGVSTNRFFKVELDWEGSQKKN